MKLLNVQYKNDWVIFCLSVVAIKFLIFYLDPLPMFFLGDSQTYLGTAVYGDIPTDRSFVYGFLIRAVTFFTHSLTSLVAAQVFFSSITAILAGHIIIRFFSTSRKVAFALGILCSIEPLQLLYERYVLTETFSLLVFAAYMVCVFYYLEKPRFTILALLQLLGTALISLRLSFLPIVLVNTVLLPLLTIPVLKARYSQQSQSPDPKAGLRLQVLRAVALQVVVSLTLTYVLHSGYKHLNGSLVRQPPAYQYQSGLFLLADWAPVIKAEDFPYPQLSGPIFGNLRFDLRDRSRRGPQRWMEGGLIENIKNVIPDPIEADRAAQITAISGLKRDPLAVVKLAADGFLDYWIPETRSKCMVTDRGDRQLPPEMLSMLQEHFHLNAASLPFVETVTNRFYFQLWPWYLILLCTPLLSLIAFILCSGKVKTHIVTVAVASAGTVAIASSLIERPTIRYLQVLGWLIFLIIGAIIGRFQQRRQLTCRNDVQEAPL